MRDATSHFITAPDGLKLHVREHGQSGGSSLPVICLPGLTRNVSDFEALAMALSDDGRRVLAIDSRGRGLSDYDPDPAKYSLPVELGDVIAVLAALRCEPAVFVGTSRGGLLTMLMAAVRPAAIAGAVLNDIGPVIETAGLARIAGYVGKTPRAKNFEEAADGLRRLFGSQFPALVRDDWIAWSRRSFKQADDALVPDYDIALARGFENFDPATPLPDMWPQFEALRAVPLMVIRGANSDLLSEETVTEMARRHPATETLVVPDQGHAPLLAEPETIELVTAFFRRCDAARQPPARR